MTVAKCDGLFYCVLLTWWVQGAGTNCVADTNPLYLADKIKSPRRRALTDYALSQSLTVSRHHKCIMPLTVSRHHTIISNRLVAVTDGKQYAEMRPQIYLLEFSLNAFVKSCIPSNNFVNTSCAFGSPFSNSSRNPCISLSYISSVV